MRVTGARRHRLPEPSRLLSWAAVLLIGTAGGALCRALGLPLPWLLGGMLATAGALASGLTIGGRPLTFPQTPRMVFTALIGVAIGGTAQPDMWSEIGEWWRSLAAVGVFVAIAQTLNYNLFRRLGGYDRATAFYCANPGGLIESVTLGEAAGGNVGLLTVQHFSRISITVTLVPLIYWALEGHAVGSAAGVTIGPADVDWSVGDVLLLGACAVLGGWGGMKVGLPAAIITGPVLLSTIVHAAGLTEASPPGWVVAVGQLVIGIGLAMRFGGLSRRLLAQGIGLGAISVCMMLAIAALMAGALSLTGEHPFHQLFMCYTPGGVVEMGLIALSLGVSPVMVTLHHVLRILFTVILMPLAGRWLVLGREERAPEAAK